MVLHSVVFVSGYLRPEDFLYVIFHHLYVIWEILDILHKMSREKLEMNYVYVKVSFAQLAIKVLNCVYAKLDVLKLLLQIVLVIQIYMYRYVRVVKNYWFSTNQIRLCWPLNLKEKLLSRETGDGLIHWTHWHSTI